MPLYWSHAPYSVTIVALRVDIPLFSITVTGVQESPVPSLLVSSCLGLYIAGQLSALSAISSPSSSEFHLLETVDVSIIGTGLTTIGDIGSGLTLLLGAVTIIFDGELQRMKYEKKSDVVRSLGIPNYGDPFYDNGRLCMEAWERGEFKKAIAHNKACLLKERDILLKRSCRTPNELKFNKVS